MKNVVPIMFLAMGLSLAACTNNSSTMAACDNQLGMPEKGEEIAVITTNVGQMKMRLFDCETPETSKNFKELAKKGFYNGLIFHRVIKDFVVQGGDPRGNGTGGESYKGPGTMIDDEKNTKLKHTYGAVAMAKRGPNTATSQFYIVNNPAGTAMLDGGYTVFGQVFEGKETLDAISNTPTKLCQPGQMGEGCDKPLSDVRMEKVEIVTVE